MKIFALLVCTSLVASTLYAQTTPSYWQDNAPAARQAAIEGFRYLSFDPATFQKTLNSTLQGRGNSTLQMPLPYGGWVELNVEPSKLLAPELAAKYPSIQVFEGKSLDGQITFRGDFTHKGFHGQLLTPEGTFYIDPAKQAGENVYLSYDRDVYVAERNRPMFEEPETLTKEPVGTFGIPLRLRGASSESHEANEATEDGFFGVIRGYRIAIAATGEYTNYHGGTVADGLAAITTTLNRVTGVYERDLAITFTLIADNDDIVYTSASNDPYTNGNPNAMLNENQANLDATIGSNNYDIGHVFGLGSSGLAAPGVTCTNGSKAQGITGLEDPVGDAFDIDFVAHEIGHQMGATHTFNGTDGFCSGNNRFGNTAMEPGSGSTIMAYANICNSDNIQGFSDDYFHVVSIIQIAIYTFNQGGRACADTTLTGNLSPEAVLPENGLVIPANTPFALTAEGSDPDGDSLTYCWEQFDVGPAGAPDAPVDNAPLFRSFQPTANPERWFPQKSDLINQTTTLGELLPSYARDMSFAVTVRDQESNIFYEFVELEVSTDTDPFTVTSPAENADYFAGQSVLVEWTAGKTMLPPFNAANVSITLSTDGGDTFSEVLAASTANDGFEYVTLPASVSTTNQAIIRVAAIGNVFFNISEGTFSIENDGSAGFAGSVSPVPSQTCSPDSAEFTVSVVGLNGFSGDITLSATNLPAGLTATFGETTLAPGESTTLRIGNTQSLNNDLQTFNVVFSSDTQPDQTLEAYFEVVPEITGEMEILFPVDMETSVDRGLLLAWDSLDNVDFYEIAVATDAGFTNIIVEDSTVFTRYEPGIELDLSTTYFWRIRGSNFCTSTEYATAEFRTIGLNCEEYTPNDVPITITTVGNVTYTSTIDVPTTSGTIFSVGINDLDITHSWIEDLEITLSDDQGNSNFLVDGICGNADDLFLSFSDNGMPAVDIPCPPTDRQVYQPQTAFSVFNDLDPTGTWTLSITDQFNDDGGSLNDWALEICVLPEFITLVALLQDDDETVIVSWESTDATDIVEWEVQQAVNDGFFETLEVVDASVTTYTVTGLQSGTRYSYRVRGIQGDGFRTDFSNISAPAIPVAIPNPPTQLVVSSLLDYQTELSWTDNSEDEEGFVIQRSEGDESSYTTIETINIQNRTTYVDPGREHAVTYFYRVAAFNSAGQSDWSESASVTVTDLDGIPEESLQLYPNPGENQLTLQLQGVNAASAQVELFTVQGQRMQVMDWENLQTPLQVNTSSLPAGVYQVRVSTEDGVRTQVWVKQ
ncbi:MAG: reprolysin-like metallopeptidase [Bacteroidota bacterium]